MSLTLRTNRWASRIIIILHLVIWNAVAIILLQKGVNILRKRILDTGYTIETNSSIDLSIESTITSIRRAENEYLAIVSAQDQLIDRNEKITIRVDPESSVRNDKNYPGLNVIKNEFEIASKEQRSTLSNPFENSTTDGQTLRIENHRENKSSSSKTSRIARDREYFLDDRPSKNTHAKENVTGSISESKEEGNRDAKEKDLNSVDDVSRESKFFARENSGRQVTNSSLRRSSNRIRFSHNSGAVTAVTMVAIGAIMLLIGPIVIILRILDERKQARKLHALAAAAREDLPPTYEQAVFSSEAPRYSSLALNDDNSLPPSPPPSPTFVFSSHVIKSHST
ncbi:uncharacterized protein LOC105250028 [Camponotus floridanus]|uniref:uncharacterized protein LOC105250028 n=1 Tax=Camponotus floridanus TaxID=104421 RepID=UPI000DC66B5E|nr:uncharacterized protein LOC105250028 [Camponotus floridanus]XP_011254187.2 uncharacterized protein LOC105250028 [Camponotus floridanus]XP_011254188.2 uncharacterized protein LOC105250028 [Camponotus floridanus]XP_011254189.2 uncharacterized protein LOC105250028 [Camponotus floridanus]XP_011254190.2 uncharacterized protein LOC105250028 [Camponotus floridanus]